VTLAHWWRGVVSGERRGAGAAVTRALLTGVAALYWVGLKANLAIYRWGLRRPTRPVLPVISVGNLTVGGSGKSPAVRYLARELQQRGVRPGIVLRGHGRADGRATVLASDGRGHHAGLDVSGDEAAEVARALPDVPVAVGKGREAAIALLAEAGVQVALLDDGYQYFRMARDLNIVLISARVGREPPRLFPRGIWREPWSHLDRADQVWITHANEVPGEQVAGVRAKVAQYAPGTPVVEAGHEPRDLISLDGEHAPLNTLAGQAVLALSGLGCPESFEYTLRKLGAAVVPLRFGDHHRYSPDDWATVAAQAEVAGASWVVTTEKDAVKLPPGPALTVRVLRSEMRLGDGRGAVAESLDRVAQLRA